MDVRVDARQHPYRARRGPPAAASTRRTSIRLTSRRTSIWWPCRPAPTSRRATSDVQERDPTALVAVTGMSTGASRDEAIGRMVDSELETLGTAVVMHAWQPSDSLEAAVRSLAPLATLMAGDVSALDPSATALRLTLDGRDVTSSLRHRLLFDGPHVHDLARVLVGAVARSAAGVADAAGRRRAGGLPAYRRSEAARPPTIRASQENGQVQARVPLAGRRGAGGLQRGGGRGLRASAAACRPSAS